MYIIELFTKWLAKRRQKEVKPEKPDFSEVDEALTCAHKFMPVDSTGEVLACTKCGFVVKRNENYRG